MPPTRISALVDLRYTTRPPTGVDKHITRMLRGLSERPGCSVSVLAPRGQLESDGSIPATSSLAGLPADALPLSNRASRMLWAVSRWPPVDRFCRAADWIYSPQELWAPARHARTAVTIHGITWFEECLPGCGSAWARFERARLSWFFRQVCRHADLVLPVSRYVETFLVNRFGLDPSKSLVVGNGVDGCFFARGVQAGAPHDPDRLLVVGGLNDWDGATHVLAAADALHAALPGMAIDVVGTFDTPRYAAAAAARPNLRRLGYLAADQLAASMPGYLALLYLPNVESFGMVALEAMAAGLPVVSCRSTAVPETVGDAAISVDATDAAAIVAAIRGLRDSSTARDEWIARGRRRAAGFTWTSCLDRLTTAFAN